VAGRELREEIGYGIVEVAAIGQGATSAIQENHRYSFVARAAY
jgi:hypothetical protein